MADRKTLIDIAKESKANDPDKMLSAYAGTLTALRMLEAILSYKRQTGKAVFPFMGDFLLERTPSGYQMVGVASGNAEGEPSPENLQLERDNIIEMIAAVVLMDTDTTRGRFGNIWVSSPWFRLKSMNDARYDAIRMFLWEYEALKLTPSEARERLTKRVEDLGVIRLLSHLIHQ